MVQLDKRQLNGSLPLYATIVKPTCTPVAEMSIKEKIAERRI